MRKFYALFILGMIISINALASEDICIIDLRDSSLPGSESFDRLVVCSKPDTLSVQVTSTAALSSASLELVLPDGLDFYGTAFSGTGQSLSETGQSSSSNPIFSLPNIGAGGDVIINIPVKGSCPLLDPWEDFLPINIDYIVQAGAQTVEFTPALAYNNQIYVPSLNILSVSPSYPAVNIGGSFIREITVSQDGLKAFLNHLYYQHNYQPGVQYNSLSVGIQGSSTIVPLTFSDSGTAVTAELSEADFAGMGLDGIFDESDILVFYEEITITTCPGNVGLSEFIFSWGCEGDVCRDESYSDGYTFATGSPNIDFSNVVNSDPDLCTEGSLNFTVINAGSEQVLNSGYAKDVVLQLSTPCDLDAFEENFDLIDLAINGTSIGTPSLNNFGELQIDLSSVLSDMDGDGQNDDLAIGDSFSFELSYQLTCASSSCGMEPLECLEGLFVEAKYNDQCDGQKPTEIVNVEGLDYGDFGYTFMESAHGISGDTEFEAMFCYSFTDGMLPCADAQVNLHFTTSNENIDPLGGIITNEDGEMTSTITQLSPNEYTVSGGTLSDGVVEDCWTLTLAYNGPCEEDGPVDFQFEVVYECPCSADGCEIVRACETYNALIESSCPGPGGDCLGVLINSMDVSRNSFGWLDNDVTSGNIANANTPGVELNRAYVCDNVAWQVGGTIDGPAGSTINDLDFVMSLIAPGSGAPFEFQGNSLIVNGQSYCTGSLPAPTVDTDGDRFFMWTFDLDACLAANNLTLEPGDMVSIEGDLIVVDAEGMTDYWKLVQFRGEFRANGNVSCDNECEDFYVLRPEIDPFANSAVQIGCNGTIMVEGSFGINSPTGDDFLVEHRPWLGNLQEVVLNVPEGLNAVNGTATMTVYDNGNAISIPIVPDNILNGHQYVFNDLGSLINLPDKTNPGLIIKFEMEFVGSCNVVSSDFIFEYTYDKFYYAILDNPECVVTESGSVSGDVFFASPAFSMMALNPIQQGTEDQVSWDVEICNTFEADASFSWLAFETPTSEINVISAEEITDSNNPVSIATEAYGNGSVWIDAGEFLGNECRTFRFTAEYGACDPDEAIIRFNWDCQNDFSGPDDAEYSCDSKEQQVYLSLLPEEAALQINLLDVSDTLDLCEDGFFELEFKNVKQGYLYDITFQIIIPFDGVDFVDNSFEISYPINSPYVPIGFEPTLVDTLPSGLLFEYNMNDVDASFIDGLDPIPAPTDTENRFSIRFGIETFCGFSSGSVFQFVGYGYDGCGQQTPGTFQNEDLHIEGADQTYSMVPDLYLDENNTCNNGTGFVLDITNSGPSTTDENAYVEIVLPSGINYSANTSAVLSSPVSSWNPGEPTVDSSLGFTVLSWDLPAGLAATESVQLSFSLANGSALTCDVHEFTINTYTSTDLICVEDNQECAVPIQTGNTVLDINVNKPNLSFTTTAGMTSSMEATCGENETESLSATIYFENTGLSIPAGNSISLGFVHDSNANGVYDAADVLVHSYDFDAGIASGATANFNASFSADAGQACPMIVVIDPEINCVCTGDEILISSIPYANAGADQTTCPDEASSLGCDPISSYTYEWSPETGLSCTDCANPDLTLSELGSYTYTLTTTRGECTSSDQVTIEVLETINSTEPTAELCEGQTVQFNGPTGLSDYQWSPVTGLSDANIPNPVATPSVGSTNYTLTFISDNGCVGTHTIQTDVTASPAPVVSLMGNDSFCFDEPVSATLDAGPGYDAYEWYGNNGSTILGTDQTYAPSVEGSYYVIVTDGDCPSLPSEPIEINILEFTGPVINNLGQSTFCEGASTTLSLTGDFAEIEWFAASNGNPSGAVLGTNNTIEITESGSFIAVVVDNNDCEGISNVLNILVQPLSTINIDDNGEDEICEGESSTLTATAGMSNYTWFLDAVEISGNTNTITVSDPGSYTVSANNTDECTGLSNPFVLTVHPNPDPQISADPIEICEGFSTTIELSESYEIYWWALDGEVIPLENPSQVLVVDQSGTYTVNVEDENGCIATSNPIVITVNSNPEVTISATELIICEGEESTLSATADFTTYQWYLNGTAIADTETITVSDAGTYSLEVSDDNGCTDLSNPIEIIVNPLPLADLFIPTNQNSFCEGGSILLELNASPGTYEWYVDNQLVQTGSEINYEMMESGMVYVTVTSLDGCINQSETLDISTNMLPMPMITPNGDQEICEGETIVLEVVGTYPSIQWFLNGNEMSGANNGSITVSNSGSYSVFVDDQAGCSGTSDPVTITVLPLADVEILEENQNVCEGESVTFSATTGYDNYNWFLNGNAINGNSSSISVDTEGAYTVEATMDGYCPVISDPVNLAVNPNPSPLTQVSNNASSEICAGESVGVNVLGNYYTMQWYNQNGPIQGAIGGAYQVSQSGSYYMVVTTFAGCTGQSDPIDITVNPNPVAEITATDVELCQGEESTITTNETFDSYQWYFNGSAIQQTQSITVGNSGTYYVTVTDENGCTDNSNPIEITVNPLPTGELTIPTNQNSFCEGGSILLELDASPGTYEWFVDGQSISTGSQTQYEMMASGIVYVVITSADGCVSQTESLDISTNSLPEPQIVPNMDQLICEGEFVNLEVLGNYASIQWFLNDVEINGANAAQYDAYDSGSYTVFVDNQEGCSGTSNPIVITVLPIADVQITEPSTTICLGESYTLTATPGYDSYDWYLNGNIFESGSNSITTTLGGNYTVEVNGEDVCPNISDPVVIDVSDIEMPDVIIAQGSNPSCTDEQVALLVTENFDSYQWYNEDGIISGQNTNSLFVTTSGDYYVVVANEFDCTDQSDPISIIMNPAPSVEISATDLNICSNETSIMTATLGFVSYTWFYNTQEFQSGQTITTNLEGNYYVVVEDENGCTAISDPVTLIVNESPNPDINSPNGDMSTCPDSFLPINATSGGVNYDWFADGELVQSGNSPQYDALPGQTVTVEVTNPSGCVESSNTFSIQADPLPEPEIIALGPTTICEGESVQLNLNGTFVFVHWHLNGVAIENANDPTYTATESGDYNVYVTNVSGCGNFSNVIPVTVNNIADIEIINPDLEICPGEATVLTASPGFDQYVWHQNNVMVGSGASNTYSTNLPGIYYVTASSGEFCAGDSQPVTVVQVDEPEPMLTFGGDNNFCEGGSVEVFAMEEFENYEWFVNGQSFQSGPDHGITISETADVYVTVTNANGCSGTSSTVSVNTNPAPNPVIIVEGEPVICEGNIVTLAIMGEYDFIQWFWNGNELETGFTNLIVVDQPGTYTVTVDNEDGCFGTSLPVDIEFSDPELPVIEAPTDTICNEDDLPVILETAAGYDLYDWYHNENTLIQSGPENTLEVFESGYYTVTVYDENGCESTSSFVEVNIGDFPPPVIICETELVACEGEDIDLFIVGPYENVQWYLNGEAITGIGDKSYSATESGDYTVIVTVNGCVIESEPITLTFLPIPEVEITATDPLTDEQLIEVCSSDQETVSLSATEGFDQYDWYINGAGLVQSGPSSTVEISETGIYTVIVTDENNKQSAPSNYINVIFNDDPTVEVTASDLEICSGESTLLTGFTSGFAYQWTPNDGSLSCLTCLQATASPESTTTYTLTVTDINGCSSSASITIPVADNEAVDIFATNGFACNGEDLILMASSGFDSYAWYTENGVLVQNGTADTYNAIASGSYYVVASNESGCQGTSGLETVVIYETQALQITVDGSGNFCDNSAVEIHATQGFVSYEWYQNNQSTGNTNSTYTATTPGTVYVVVSDDNGCVQVSDEIMVSPQGGPDPQIIVMDGDLICPGTETTLSVTGDYDEIIWYLNGEVISSGGFNTISASQSGLYTVSVNDNNGCEGTAPEVEINILETGTLSISPEGPLDLCGEDQVTLTATEGMTDYTWYQDEILLIQSGTSNTLVVENSGNYSVVGTNEDGCVIVSNIVNVDLGQIIDPVLFSSNPNNVSCPGYDLIIYAPVDAASYSWSPQDEDLSCWDCPNPIANPSETKTFTLTMTSFDGCESTGEITIFVPDPDNPQMAAVTVNGICEGGSVTLEADAGYDSYAWYTNGTTLLYFGPDNTYEASTPGDYYVVVINSDGCSTASDDVFVDILPDPELPELSAGDGTSICDGGGFILYATSGDDIYEWTINGSQATSDPTNAVLNYDPINNAFSVTVSNEYGCTAQSATVYLNAIDNPSPAIIYNAVPLCEGYCADLSVPSNYAEYQWYNNGIEVVGEAGPQICATEDGFYSVAVTDFEGCIGLSEGVNVEAFASFNSSISINPGNVTACESDLENGGVLLTATEGFANYNWYLFETILVQSSPNNTFLATSTGIYSVQSSAGQTGCFATSELVYIEINPAPVLNVSASDVHICPGETAYLFASCPLDNIEWTTGGDINSMSCTDCLDPAVSPTETTTYVATITDDSGCSTSKSITIHVQDLPSLEITAQSDVINCENPNAILIASEGFEYYTWLNQSGVIVQTGYSNIFQTTQAGTYSAIAETSSGCSQTSNNTYEISGGDSASPYASISVNGSFCTNEDVQLNATFGYETYEWFVNGISQGESGINSFVLTTNAEVYVSVTNEEGCTGTSLPVNIQVGETPAPEIYIVSGNTPFCSEDAVQLAVTGLYDHYQWYLNGIAIPNTNAPLIEVNETGNYWIYVLNDEGCEAYSAELNLEVYPDLELSISPNTIQQCELLAPETLTASEGFDTYNWYLNGLLFASGSSNELTVGQSGTYTVEAYTNAGCFTEGDYPVVVEFYPTTPLNIFASDYYSCTGEEIQLYVNGNGENYSWSANTESAFVECNSCYSTTVTVYETTTFSVTMTDVYGCDIAGSITILAAGEEEPVITSTENVVCNGSFVDIEAQGFYQDYQWYLDGLPIYLAEWNHLLAYLPGEYYVEVVDIAGCVHVSEVFTILDGNIDTPEISIMGSTDFCDDEIPVILDAGYMENGEPFTYYFWYKDGVSAVYAYSQALTVTESGTYQVEVKDEFGCSALSAPIVVTVSSVGEIPIYASTNSICDGGTSLLFCSFGSDNTVFWFNSNQPNVALNSESAESIEVSEPGDYYAQVYTPEGCEGTSNVISIEINPNPEVGLDPSEPVVSCGETGIVLSANGNMTAYQWFVGGEEIPFANAQAYLASTSGIYGVNVTDENGCENYEEVSITLNEIGSVEIYSSDTEICNGEMTEMYAVTDGDYSIYWYHADQPGVALNAVSQNIIEVGEGGNYFAQIISAEGCMSVSNTITIDLIPDPEVGLYIPSGINEVCAGESIFMTAFMGFASYTWYKDGVAISNQGNLPAITVNESGIYTVSIVSNEGCTNSQAIEVIVNETEFDYNPIVQCESSCGAEDGLILLNFNQSAQNLMLNWEGPAGYSSSDASIFDLIPGTYHVLITDENGCSMEDSFEVCTPVTTLNPQNDFATTLNDVAIEICILSNDGGANIGVSNFTQGPNNGQVEMLSNDCILYTPNEGFVGTDNFTYNVFDICGNTGFADVIVDVESDCQSNINAVDDYFNVDFNSAITYCILDNDQGTDLNINGIVEQPQYGSVSFAVEGCVLYTPNEGYAGQDSYTYVIVDECNNFAQGTVYITVDEMIPANDPPYEEEGTFCVNAEEPTTICFDFTDPNGDNTIIVDHDSFFDCIVGIANDSCIVYTSLSGLTAPDVLTLTVCDDQNPTACSESVFVIGINGYDGPCDSEIIANDDNYNTDVNTPISVCVTNNDIGEDVSISSISLNPQNGSVSSGANGCLIYLPNPGFTGTDCFNYIIEDVYGNTDEATVCIEIEQADNLPPVSVTLEYCVMELDPFVICYDFEDPEGFGTVITEVESLFECSVEILEDDCIRYVALPGLEGPDTLTLTVCDTNNPPACSTSTYIIHIGCNTPEPVSDLLIINCGEAYFNTNSIGSNIQFDVTENDADNFECNDNLTVEFTTSPINGSLNLVNGNVYSYSPDSDFTGTEIINYTVCNDCGECSSTSLTINSQACTPPDPDCNNTTAVCAEPVTPTTLCASFCNLSMENNPQFYLIDNLYNCSISISDFPCVVYTALPGFVGNDLMELIACDDTGLCDTAYISINVGECLALEAIDDLFDVEHNTATVLDVLSNDHGTGFQITDFSQGAYGSVSSANGGLEYTPNEGFYGNDSFTYTICDENGACDEATAFVSVAGACNNVFEMCTSPGMTINICPEFCTVPEGAVLDNIDSENDALITQTDNFCFDYQAPQFNTSDVIIATICSPDMTVCSSTYITLDVACTQPSAEDDFGIMLAEFGSLAVDVLFNDSDQCHENLGITYASNPENGQVYLVGEGTIVYEPTEGFVGSDVFSYITCNPCGLCDTAYVFINVQGEGVVDMAMDDAAETYRNQSTQINVLANDLNMNNTVDIDGWTVPNKGQVLLLNNQEFVYMPETNYVGVDSFTYQICANGVCDEAMVRVVINDQEGSEENAPIATNDQALTGLNQSVLVEVLVNDQSFGLDPELSITSTIENAGLVLNGNGTILVIPETDFVGTISFTYQVCNDQGLCDEAIVEVVVSGEEILPPVAQDDSESTLINEPVGIEILVNDYDPQGLELSYSISNFPENGSIRIESNNDLFYVPNEGFSGIDEFVYELCNEAGLCVTAKVSVEVKDCELFIPNAFSPNGDGVNDRFEVLGLECFESVELQVFNRWGSEVFISSDYNSSTLWDGEFGIDGKELPDGVYYFVLTLEADQLYQGYITIKR